MILEMGFKKVQKAAMQNALSPALKERASYDQYYVGRFDLQCFPNPKSIVNPFYFRELFFRKRILATYEQKNAVRLLAEFQEFCEQEMKSIIESYSQAYWTYLIRRIPLWLHFTGELQSENKFERLILESACNKYGIPNSVTGLEFDSAEWRKKWFPNGPKEFLEEKIAGQKWVVSQPDGNEIEQLIRLRQIARELLSITHMRLLSALGAPIQTSHSYPFYESLANEEQLLSYKVFDGRRSYWEGSRLGYVYDEVNRKKCILPYHEPSRELLDEHFQRIENRLGQKLALLDFNSFVPHTFPLDDFYRIHQHLEPIFYQRYGISIASIFCFVRLVSERFAMHLQENDSRVHFCCRAYETGLTKEFFVDAYRTHKDAIIELPHCSIEEFSRTIDFLTLNTEDQLSIDVSMGYPVKPLLVLEDGTYQLDYAWISQMLINLFSDLPSSTSPEKGTNFQLFLEKHHTQGFPIEYKFPKIQSALKRRTDASILVGDILLLVEAKSMHLENDFLRGDYKAVRKRETNVIRKALTQGQEIAEFIATDSTSIKHHLDKIDGIFSVAVSSFNELVRKRDANDWITDRLPRVMNRFEFEDFIASPDFESIVKGHPSYIKLQKPKSVGNQN